jgi:hypothetical protein
MGGGLVGVVVLLSVIVLVGSRFHKISKPAKVLSVLGLSIGACIVLIIATLQLETAYYTDVIQFRFFSVYKGPFEVVAKDSIVKAEVVTYNPTDYGGWGVKGDATTRVYNAVGDKGVMFTFARGKRLLLGTRQPDSIAARLYGHYPISTAR